MTVSRKSCCAVDRPIVLVGMMGAGKTTIGRRLAPRLGLKFHDADQEIEKAAGMSVSELFRRHGEESFRAGEARVIARLLDAGPHVLATGGGALINADTRAAIAEKAISIWIRADLDTLTGRATRRGTRPLLKSGDPKATIARLLEERRPFYETANLHIDSQPGPHENTVREILDRLTAYCAVADDPNPKAAP